MTSTLGMRVRDLAVKLGGREVIHRISFDLSPGVILAMIGQSGSGKTTLLRALAGLVPISYGRIELGDRRIETQPAYRRGIVYLSQEPLLFPHLNVRDNIGFGPRLTGQPRVEVTGAVDRLISALDLRGLERRDPASLSGGERQRVAFGRALAAQPAVLLLDEPFASLDPATRTQMQALFLGMARDLGLSAIFVTHDLKECLSVGDRYAAIRDGTCHLYPDRASFCADPASGVAAEAAFWSSASADGREPIGPAPRGGASHVEVAGPWSPGSSR